MPRATHHTLVSIAAGAALALASQAVVAQGRGAEPEGARPAAGANAGANANADRNASADAGGRANANAGTLITFAIPGEFQARLWSLSPIPLQAPPGETEPSTLGQTLFSEMWFRFRPELAIGPSFRVVSQFDVGRGIPFGQSTRQVELSRDARSTVLSSFPYTVFDLRQLYVDWTTPIGVVRAGQQGSHWGLGIVANDGDHPPVFGDYRMGDLVERVAFATRPFGRESDVVVALAGDLVYRDRIASLRDYEVPVERGAVGRGAVPTRTLGGDVAWQAIASVFYQRRGCTSDCERKRVGFYAVYRDQRDRAGEDLRVAVADVFARWEWPTPDGLARVFAAIEVAGIFGTTSLARNPQFARHDVVQVGGATELGIERDGRYRVTLAAGYASGDADPTDGVQRRFTFNPSYRVGLVLFPEVLAWQTARSASIAVDERVVGRPTRGAELLPSSGGVTNAMYFNPTAVVNLTRWLDVRAGMVVGVSTSDVVDPAQVTITGNARNYRGGNAAARDLGLELDGAVMARRALGGGITVTGGVQAGVLFPGRALDDASGTPMRTVGVAIARAGLVF